MSGDKSLPAGPPTVLEASRIGGFVHAELVAGEAGLDRTVEWVRTMETPEIVKVLRPGDLLLTAAYASRGDADAQKRLVEGVAGAGGAGLVLKVTDYVPEVPPEMMAAADQAGLPLFRLPQEVNFVDLMEPLLERIINAEHWRLKRSLEIHRRFTDIVLDGKGVNEIARTLAELTEGAVTVEDASFHLLAHAGGSLSDPHRKETIQRHGTPPRVVFDPQIQRVLRQLEASRHPAKVPPYPHVGMTKARVLAPILAGDQVLGYISVLDTPPQNDELVLMAVEQASLAVALALSKEREVAEVEGRVRGEFLDDLVQGTFGDEAAAQRRARHVGYGVPGVHLLLQVDIDDFRGFVARHSIAEDAIQAIKREYVRRVAGATRSAYPHALFTGHSDSVFVLLPLGVGADPGESQRRAHALAVQIQETLAAWRPGFTVSVGFSATFGFPFGVEAAAREVGAVLDTLSRFRRWGSVVSVADLGLTGLLAGVTDDRLLEFATRHLGPLVERDRTRGGHLVDTLRAFLESGEQQAAARLLKVHPNTLRYRLDRIHEITGADLDSPESRLNLAVALRVHALLGL